MCHPACFPQQHLRQRSSDHSRAISSGSERGNANAAAAAASPWTGTPEGPGAPASRPAAAPANGTDVAEGHTRPRTSAPGCVSCVAFPPAADRRNGVRSARSGAPRLPLLACYTAVPAGRIVRRCTPCRRPEIPSKLTQKLRSDQFGFPSQYLSVYFTKSIELAFVSKICCLPEFLQSLGRIGRSGEEIFDRKSGGEAHSEPSS